jgi:sialic acid synthase SpsE
MSEETELPKGRTTIIAEIGQNHNGEMTIARQLIDMAAMKVFDKFDNRELPGVTAVKFTKRDLTEELTVDAYDEPYDSVHSFGRTYGEHREKLELSYEEHAELERYARSKGLGFVETLTSLKTLRLLDTVDVDAVKVASRDLTNLPLLDAIAQTRKRIILSTGMGADREIEEALAVITRHHEDVAILHCVSQYPASYENMNLLAIQYLRDRFPYEIGLSDHSIGIVMAPVAVALGASIIEKHITLNRGMKGSDHAASLEPDGLWRMVRDIRNVETALGEKSKIVPPDVELARRKLGRSLAAAHDIKDGQVITEGDLCLLSPGTGLQWAQRESVVGRVARRRIAAHTLIDKEDLRDGRDG